MKSKLLETFHGFGDGIALAVPKVLIGAILVALGLVFAKLVEAALRAMLVRLRFEGILRKVGVTTALQKLGVREQLNVSLPKMAYFLVLCLLTKIASDELGLVAISEAMAAFFAYLPNILAALLLLALGVALGQLAGRVITQLAANARIDSASALGRLVSAFVVFIVAMMAVSELKIDTTIVRIVISFILATAAIGFGLAFGWGAREIVRNILAGFYARKFLRMGQNLEISGTRGVLISITATHAVVTTQGENVAFANSTFLEQSCRQ